MLKRFEAVSTYDGTDEGMLNEVISPSGERMGPVECADLLNSQAETIEVLREWLRDEVQFPDVEYEQVMIQRATGADRVELAIRRIAALEGK